MHLALIFKPEAFARRFFGKKLLQKLKKNSTPPSRFPIMFDVSRTVIFKNTQKHTEDLVKHLDGTFGKNKLTIFNLK